MSRSSQVLALLMVPVSLLQAAIYEVAQRDPQASDEAPGTTERPWKTIGRAAASVAPGDVVVIRGGVYRERVLVKTSGTPEAPIRFEAAPGEHVLVTGADRLTDWRRVDDSRPVYSVAWPHRFITWNRSMTHPDDEYHRLIGRCEQVIVDGLLLRQVLSADQIAPGAFFADVTNRTLLVWDIGSRDANKLHVEASVRQEVLRVEGDHVRVRGLRFRYAANMAQHGAVVLAGRHDTMEDCVVEEISFALHAHDNVIVGNGFAPTAGAWGAQAGISLSSSPGCVIERNLIVGNREGFNFREQPRTTPTIEDRTSRPVWNHDQLIRHNVIAFNRDAQVWGWFDVKDNRHWPPGQPAAGPAERGEGARAGDTSEATATKPPEALSLELLRLQFVNNVYFATPGQAWFEWGPTWAQHQSYSGLTAFQSALGLDTGGQVLDPGFVDLRQGDLRLRPETRDRLREHYPRGPVPGVIREDGL